MRKRLKSFISLMLVLIMSLQLAIPSFASELSTSDDADVEFSSIVNDEDFQEEMRVLDELAKYYYDYYQENGEYPSEDVADEYYQDNIQVTLDSTEASPDSISLYMSGSTAASLLTGAGFSITTANLAELAASLGSLAGIGTALPVVVVIAIIIGVTYAAYTSDVSKSGVKKLGSKSSSVAGEIGTYVKSNKAEAKSNAREAVITSADYVRNRREYVYFECERVNYDGLGGILIGEPLTEKEAILIVKNNKRYSSDIFCVTPDAAAELAILGSDLGEDPYFDFAHDVINKPYNCPHYHASIDGDRGKVHIFYEDDVW